MTAILNSFAVLKFAMIYLAIQSHGLAMQSPFIEDTLFMHKKTAISLFKSRLVDLLNSLSARRHCRFVSNISNKLGLNISRTQDLINGIQKSLNVSRSRAFKKRRCRHWHTRFNHPKNLAATFGLKYNESIEYRRRHIISRDLPKLYNNLPLPFQCEILFEVGRLSAMNGLDISRNSVNSVTKMNLYEVGNVIKKSEKVISNQISMVKVADRCVKVLAGEKYRTTDIVVSVDIGNQQFQKWKRDFRNKMPWVCGKFALDNGIKIENIHNLTVKKNLPFSAYFTHILNATSIGHRHEVKFHMHLIQANSMALEARFVLAALNAVSKKTLRTIFGVRDIRYWAVDHYIGVSLQGIRSYSLKRLFPTYLRSFFNTELKRHERCLIIHIIAKYSNSSTEKVMKFLKRKRVDVQFPCSIVNGVMSVVLSPKRNRENELHPRKTERPVNNTTRPTLVLHPYWHVHHKDPSPKAFIENSMQRKIVHYKKATMVEIVMFVLLGALGIVIIIFTITCTLFMLRKRAIRKEERELAMQQERLDKDCPRIVVDASRLSDEEFKAEIGLLKWKSERLSRPVCWSQENSNVINQQKSVGDSLIGVRLEPLRFSTDDEESRCDDDEVVNCHAYPAVRQSGVFFLGNRGSVDIAQINKRNRLKTESECSTSSSNNSSCVSNENTTSAKMNGTYEMKTMDTKMRNLEGVDSEEINLNQLSKKSIDEPNLRRMEGLTNLCRTEDANNLCRAEDPNNLCRTEGPTNLCRTEDANNLCREEDPNNLCRTEDLEFTDKSGSSDMMNPQSVSLDTSNHDHEICVSHSKYFTTL